MYNFILMNRYQQQNPYFFQIISDLLSKNMNSRVFNQKKYRYLYDWMIQVVNKNINKIKFTTSTLIYWIINGLEDYPACENPVCKNKILVNVYTLKAGFKRHCSMKCSTSDPNVVQQHKKTCRETYGNENYTNREKSWETTEKHFGVKYPQLNDEIHKKSVKTCQKKYNTDCFMKSAQFKQTSVESLRLKYGVTNSMQIPGKSSEVKRTKHKLYGDENFNNRDKYHKTCLAHFGVDHNFKTQKHRRLIRDNKDEYNEKKRHTYIKHFGISHPPSRRYMYDNIYFDSAPELAFYIWLKDQKIDFEYQPTTNLFYEFNNIKHKYEPDFLVDGQLYELKGDHFFENKDISKKMINPFNRDMDDVSEAKHQFMLENNVKILTSKDYQKYLEYVSIKYGKHYLRKFKIS